MISTYPLCLNYAWEIYAITYDKSETPLDPMHKLPHNLTCTWQMATMTLTGYSVVLTEDSSYIISYDTSYSISSNFWLHCQTVSASHVCLFFIYLHFFLLCFHPLSCPNPLFNHHLSHLPVITVRLCAFVLCTTACKHTISKIHLSKGSNLKSTSDLTVI